jgi:hypothetical protein
MPELPAAGTEAPNVEIESFRYMQKDGAKSGTVSIVVGGVHHLFPCKPKRAAGFAASVLEAIAKGD